MTSKQKSSPAKPAEVEYPRKTALCITTESGEERGRKYAEMITSPEFAMVRIIAGAEAKSGVGEHIDVPTLMEQLRTQAAAVNDNDLTQAEAVLMNQATALQSLFAHLTVKAMSIEHLPQFEGFMRMALRAQNQCRTTLETLAAIKSPPLIYARQANIAHGNQQVNNGAVEPATHAGDSHVAKSGFSQASHARRKTEIAQNELLTEVTNGQAVDNAATGATIRINTPLEAVGEVNRRKNTKG